MMKNVPTIKFRSVGFCDMSIRFSSPSTKFDNPLCRFFFTRPIPLETIIFYGRKPENSGELFHYQMNVENSTEEKWAAVELKNLKKVPIISRENAIVIFMFLNKLGWNCGSRKVVCCPECHTEIAVHNESSGQCAGFKERDDVERRPSHSTVK